MTVLRLCHVLRHALRHALRHVVLALAMLGGAAWAQQAVEVPSLDRPAGQPIMLPGFWFVTASDSPAPAPAMLLLHGCGGMYDSRGALGSRYRSLAARLNALGVHVLVADSLTDRKSVV